ncbi:carboxylesterase family protein [Roseiarcaceae bacterium H3SJ34-1]|uniref:carboxylesterase/lipase family protein n=1 Tax=Terripilifer ovatus TaxID=3032367 RepID=UPI003AB9874D|nr:carboxylesterase family protein [Roseiarcaceae bacterium H3SJ34-1]
MDRFADTSLKTLRRSLGTLRRSPGVRVDGGMVAGLESEDGSYVVYKGIPYARPPVGDLRWRSPQPVVPWSGELKATSFSAICPQPISSEPASIANSLFFTPSGPQSEDCLYLNIWSGAGTSQKLRPVMVWIPGGGFRAGSAAGPLYDGAALARKGVVLVSLNYRVFKFGFLAHPDLTAESPTGSSGNYGLMDQIAALQWVQRNIAAFGGDPDRVTIFGQSAGSHSVNYLMASPLARGLFARAIGQSCAGFGPQQPGSLLGRSLQFLREAEKDGLRMADALGAGTISHLRAKSAEDILASPSRHRFDSSWPIIDGHVLPRTVDETFADGAQHDIPLITGSTDDEGTIFPSHHSLDAYRNFAHAAFAEHVKEFLNLYPAHDDASAQAASEDAFRDRFAGWANWTWAEAQSRSGRAVFYYQFSHRPPVPATERYVENASHRFGAFHGAELPYVFGNRYPASWEWSRDDAALAQQISDYWINFARNGDPNGPGLPVWPQYAHAEPKAMRFGQESAAGAIAQKDKFDFWTRYGKRWDKSKEKGGSN